MKVNAEDWVLKREIWGEREGEGDRGEGEGEGGRKIDR